MSTSWHFEGHKVHTSLIIRRPFLGCLIRAVIDLNQWVSIIKIGFYDGIRSFNEWVLLHKIGVNKVLVLLGSLGNECNY